MYRFLLSQLFPTETRLCYYGIWNGFKILMQPFLCKSFNRSMLTILYFNASSSTIKLCSQEHQQRFEVSICYDQDL